MWKVIKRRPKEYWPKSKGQARTDIYEGSQKREKNMGKNGKTLKDTALWLVDSGLKRGADDVEAAVSEGFEFTVEIRMGEIERLTEAGSMGLSLKIIKDKKTAYASSEDFSPDILENLLNSTIERAALGHPDECAGLPGEQGPPVNPGPLDLYDSEIKSLSADQKIKLAVETEKIALADKNITNSHGASFGSFEGRGILANSNGFAGEYEETSCYLGVGLQAGDTDAKVEDYWACGKRHFKELESPEEIAGTCVERTVRQLGARKIRTCQAPVVFEPGMTASLLKFLFVCAAGTSIYKQASFLTGMLGRKAGNDNVTVIDDGLMPGKLGSRPFDGEGVSTRKTTVLDKGILANYLCDTYSARKLKLQSTGNGRGGSVGPNNFYLEPGPYAEEEIIGSVDKGLLLTRTIGHGLNPVTGDISRGAYGLWIEKGRIAYPVSEITICGNLGKMLKEIEMVGKDLDFRGSIAGPMIKVKEMTIGGI